MDCDLAQTFEVHMLTCEKDTTLSLWALKTFSLALGYTPPIVIHDDGSLTDESCRLLLSHFPGLRLVRDAETESNGEFHEYLSQFPLTKYWRLEVDSPFARKVTDVPFFSSRDYIVLLDSDILFFQRPTSLCSLLERRAPFISRDYQSAYLPPLQELRNHGTVIDENLNTGICGMPKKYFDLHWAERFFSVHTQRGWFPWAEGWLEQTITGGMFTCCANRSVLERSEYSLSYDYLTDATCSHHYVGDGSRALYYSVGLRHLHKMKVLRALGIEPINGSSDTRTTFLSQQRVSQISIDSGILRHAPKSVTVTSPEPERHLLSSPQAAFDEAKT